MEYSGYPAKLKVDIASVYTDIAQVRDISGPSMSAETIDVSHRDGGGWKEYVAGLRDGGEVTFDIVYDPDLTTHSASVAGGVVKMLSDGTNSNFRVQFSDTTPATATFAGFVTKFTPKAPLNGVQNAEATIKVSGAIAWA